jgi:hypothetical protein
MKYLIMCEGPNELEIVKILLENDLLLFDKAAQFDSISCQTD